MKMVKRSSNLDATNNGQGLKKKERHIVSWSQEEDDILREQIRLHGSENWAIIASKFKDKTTRQCRRRWFTYLNSDFKKGGWSPEEDMLLCEAQRVYGNRWTEIAKVVSGRTDNAVKNRFTTLCKKKAKLKESSTTCYVNLNNKRIISRNGLNSDEGSDNALKKIRTYISTIADSCKQGENLVAHPFAAVGRSIQSCDGIKEEWTDKSMGNKFTRTFLEKDNPKVLALMQQEELLSSLAIKVNTEKTDRSLESAWMVLQDFLKQKKESEMVKSEMVKITNGDADSERQKFKESEEDVRSCDEGSRSSSRELDVYESSPTSSDYSTGSTLVPNVPHNKKEECEEEISALHQETGHVLLAERLDLSEDNAICHVESTDEVKNMSTYKGGELDIANTEFSSPTNVTPLFRALAATIPSPKFSESEKHFLMKTLGLESSSPTPITYPSQPPPCKRSLLHRL